MNLSFSKDRSQVSNREKEALLQGLEFYQFPLKHHAKIAKHFLPDSHQATGTSFNNGLYIKIGVGCIKKCGIQIEAWK